MAGLSRALCEAVRGLRYEDLPPEVVGVVKRLVVDALGLIAGGAHAPGIAALNARLARWEPDGSATALLGPRRHSPPTAALANGAAAHALDFDDLHDGARVHTSPIVLPAVLATAEGRGGIDGRRFIRAMAIGAEVHARLGLACPASLAQGWHPTMIHGALAASLAAGTLLDLDAARLNDALGLAFHQTSGSAQSMHDGVLAKRLGAGFAARAAVLAAHLAADGLTGIQRVLEGDAGLFNLYARGDALPERVLDGWAREWRTAEYSFKPYPGCRCNHTAIALAIGLQRDGLRPAAIASIEIGLGRVNARTVGRPYDAALGSVVHAQFNAAYSVAHAIACGRVDPATYEQPAIGAPEVVALAARTRVVVDPDIPEQAIAPARLRVTLRDGTVREVASPVMIGSPHSPMTDADIAAKLAACLAYGLGRGQAEADRILDAVGRLDAAADAAGALRAAFPAPCAIG